MRCFLAATLLACGIAAAAVPASAVELVVGGTAFRNTEGERLWLEFRDALTANRGADVQPKMLIYGELGSEEQIVSGLRRGRVQYANLSANIATTVVPEVSLIYAPFLFEDADEADYVLDNYLTPEYEKLFASKGLVFIQWFEIGFHHIYSRNKPILTPADAKGVRFRVAASEAATLLARALDADVIPLAYADVIPSLQTGLIEAGENSVVMYSRTGIAPEAPHLTLTGHSLGMSVIVAQKRFWDRLEPGQRKAIREAFPSVATTRAAIRGEERRDLEAAGRLGFEVHPLSSAARRQWAEATASTHAALVRSIGGEAARLYDLVRAAKREYAARRAAASGPRAD
jgi:TRAP-type C4-dicarboxylate transport system substrate-binding protein